MYEGESYCRHHPHYFLKKENPPRADLIFGIKDFRDRWVLLEDKVVALFEPILLATLFVTFNPPKFLHK